MAPWQSYQQRTIFPLDTSSTLSGVPRIHNNAIKAHRLAMCAYCAQKLSFNHKPALEAASLQTTSPLPQPRMDPPAKTSRQNKAEAIKIACFPGARSCSEIKLSEKGLPHIRETPATRLSHRLLLAQLRSRITRRREGKNGVLTEKTT